jgi:hypothetical protein
MDRNTTLDAKESQALDDTGLRLRPRLGAASPEATALLAGAAEGGCQNPSAGLGRGTRLEVSEPRHRRDFSYDRG